MAGFSGAKLDRTLAAAPLLMALTFLRKMVSRARSGPSPLWPIMEKFVRDECEKLDRVQITPWAFLKSGSPMRVTDFHGREICYQGIGFEGSPCTVFWSRYIEPFLEDIAFRAVDHALKLSAEKGVNPQRVLTEVQGLLHCCTRKTLERMSEIDARLRKRSLLSSPARRSIDRERRAMEQFIDARITAELAIVRRSRSRWKAWNAWWREHPLLGWSIMAVIALIGLISKLFGAW
jgi:hypothetical protein